MSSGFRFFFFFQEALEIFNTNSLAKYLQAVEELKHHAPSDEKLRLEEQYRDACAKWEVRAAWASDLWLWCWPCSSSEPIQASSVAFMIQLGVPVPRLRLNRRLPQARIMLSRPEGNWRKKRRACILSFSASLQRLNSNASSPASETLALFPLSSTKASSLGWSSFRPTAFL